MIVFAHLTNNMYNKPFALHRTPALDHHDHGLQQDPDIQPDAPVLDVLGIEPGYLVEASRAL